MVDGAGASLVRREVARVKMMPSLIACLAAALMLVASVASALAAAPSQGHEPMPLLKSPVDSLQMPDAAWRLALLPRQSKPVTDFSVVTLDEQRVLRVAASKSYGKLLHPVPGGGAKARRLAWDWRVDVAPSADLRNRSGDDVALRVCAFYDWPLERLPLVDRLRLSAAELIAGEPLPSAAICYMWDSALPTGTIMPNAFTRRIRMIVVDGDGTSKAQWREHRRDLHRDFRTAFADEWVDGDAVPPLVAVVIGADTDNTASESLGFVRSISLDP